MADENHRSPLGHVALALIMDLGDKRAGGVQHWEPAAGSFFLHGSGDAVRAEDGDRIRRHLKQILDEDRALGFQAFHDMLVVNDLMADVDRRAVFLERPFDDLDSPDHAGTKAARLSQKHFHGAYVSQVPPCSLRHAGIKRGKQRLRPTTVGRLLPYMGSAPGGKSRLNSPFWEVIFVLTPQNKGKIISIA